MHIQREYEIMMIAAEFGITYDEAERIYEKSH